MPLINDSAQKLIARVLGDYSASLLSLATRTDLGIGEGLQRRFSAEAHIADTLAEAVGSAQYVLLEGVDRKDHNAKIWDEREAFLDAQDKPSDC